MSRRSALMIAAILVVVAAVSVFVAAGTTPNTIAGTGPINSVNDLRVLKDGPQPSLSVGQGFINTERLTDADLKGKVVVYDFWTYSCINCVRTMPYLRAWHERYEKDGLVLVGVHSPEFEFEKDHGNVKDAVKRLKINYPVVLDDDMDIWNAFSNQYWPAKYVTDRSGDVRYAHFGEGEYSQTEAVLRLLLGVDKDSPLAEDPKRPESKLTAATTRETYLGSLRGGDDHVTLTGRWTRNEEHIESTTAHEALEITYSAGEVNLVMDRTVKNPTFAVIELDGKPVPKRYRGAAITERAGVEAEPETVVRIDAADLYNLIINGPEGDHELRIKPVGSGVRAFAFTFGE